MHWDMERQSSSNGSSFSSPTNNHQRDNSDREQLTREFAMRDGLETLELLASIPYHSQIVAYWHDNVTLSMIKFWMPPIKRTLEEDIFANLEGKPDHEARQYLIDWVNRIHDSSVKPIVVTRDTTVQDYSAQVSGSRLRWESLGVYVAALGLAAMQINDHAFNEIRRSKESTMQSRLKIARHMLRACQACMSLCSWIGQATDLESWLALEYHHMSSLVEGDASHATWRSLSDLLSICFIKGLNGKISVSSDVPFWLSEMRKRLFGAAYIIDKDLSTLLGRPPRLLRRYCHMQMPLDLNGDVLGLSPIEIEEKLANLDEFGWNHELLSGMTWVRCGLILQMIREDVLNFEHSTVPVDFASLARDVHHHNEEAWLSIPSWIRTSDTSATSPDLVTEQRHVAQFVHLAFAHNKFILRRANLKKLLVGYEELISTAQELLGRALDIVQSMTPDQAVDQSWVLALSGMPAAYVLGIELLQQWQDKGTRKIATFRRSETIQSLSKMITSLRWSVPRQHGDYEFCTKARLLLQKILDLVLGGQRTTSAANGAAITTNVDPVISILWSDEIRSEPDLWLLLSKHPLLTNNKLSSS